MQESASPSGGFRVGKRAASRPLIPQRHVKNLLRHQADAYYQRTATGALKLVESPAAAHRTAPASQKISESRGTLGRPRELMGSPPGNPIWDPERAGCPRQPDPQVHGLTAAGCAREAPENPKGGQARAREIRPARTTSRRPRSADCRSTATDRRTVPTDRRQFARRRGPVGTHPTAENFRPSIRDVRAPLTC